MQVDPQRNYEPGNLRWVDLANPPVDDGPPFKPPVIEPPSEDPPRRDAIDEMDRLLGDDEVPWWAS